jgi:hypothetical protein
MEDSRRRGSKVVGGEDVSEDFMEGGRGRTE